MTKLSKTVKWKRFRHYTEGRVLYVDNKAVEEEYEETVFLNWPVTRIGELKLPDNVDKTKLAFKFLRRSGRGGIQSCMGKAFWRVGRWQKIEESLLPLRLCGVGFHCSPTIRAAREYIDGNVLALVEYRGDIDFAAGKYEASPAKLCSREMRILRAWNTDTVKAAIDPAAKVRWSYHSQRRFIDTFTEKGWRDAMLKVAPFRSI